MSDIINPIVVSELRYPTLYSFRRCPYAMRARMAIHYAGIKTILREVVLSDKPADMLRLSAKATVPVLLLESGVVIDESLDIMQWALAIADKDAWRSKLNTQQLSLANKLISENDTEFKLHLDHYKYAERFPQQRMEDSRVQAEVFLDQLEQHLQQHDYLLTNTLSFADVAIFPFIRQFAHVDLVWFKQTRYVHVQRWLQALLDSAGFNAVMAKHPTWQPSDAVSFL